jgi:hypothetical protein
MKYLFLTLAFFALGYVLPTIVLSLSLLLCGILTFFVVTYLFYLIDTRRLGSGLR